MYSFRRCCTMLFILSVVALICTAAAFGQATLTSDKSDYAPGTTATLTGAGFSPGEIVSVVVHHADATPDTGAEHQPWTVTADANGGFVTTWHVCEDDCIGATLKASADGQSSTLHADAIFTDAVFTLNENLAATIQRDAFSYNAKAYLHISGNNSSC